MCYWFYFYDNISLNFLSNFFDVFGFGVLVGIFCCWVLFICLVVLVLVLDLFVFFSQAKTYRKLTKTEKKNLERLAEVSNPASWGMAKFKVRLKTHCFEIF